MVRALFDMVLAMLLLSSAATADDGILLSQSLSNSDLAYEDSTQLEISLQWTGPQSAYLFDRPLQPELLNLKVGAFASSITTAGEGAEQTTTKVYRFTLIPTGFGLGRIEPVTIPYLQWPDSVPGQLITEAMQLDIAEPIPQADDSSSASLWLIIGPPIVAIVLFLVLRGRRRNRRANTVVENPHEALVAGFARAKAEADNDLKRFQSAVHTLLDGYLRKDMELDPEAIEEDSLVKALTEKGLTAGRAERLAEWYHEAAKDKFRPVSGGPGEVIRREAELRQFFENM